MKLNELTEGLPVAVCYSANNVQPAIVITVRNPAVGADDQPTTAKVEIETEHPPCERRWVDPKLLRPYVEWERWAAAQEYDDELREELRAQVQALNLDRRRDGIRVQARGPYASVTVQAYGVSAARLLRLVRQHFVFRGRDHD